MKRPDAVDNQEIDSVKATMALLSHLQSKHQLDQHEGRYVLALEKTLSKPTDFAALRLDLERLTTELLAQAPNAGKWYALIDVIAPGCNPSVPERYIGTCELQPISIDWNLLLDTLPEHEEE